MSRLIDADVLREEVYSWGMNDYEPSDFTDAIDDAPTVEAIPKADYESRLKADYVSKKKIAQATNKIIKCSLGEWYAGRVDGKTEEVVLMDDVLHIMQGLLNEKEQINEN